MRKLKKGDRVVITCSDKRENFETRMATVVTSGSKWVTVQLDGQNYPMPYWFDVEKGKKDDVLYGGCKDGSFAVFRLYDFNSLEAFLEHCEVEKKRMNMASEIIDKAPYLPYDVLLQITNIIDSL